MLRREYCWANDFAKQHKTYYQPMHAFIREVWLVTKEICSKNISGRQFFLLNGSMKLAHGQFPYPKMLAGNGNKSWMAMLLRNRIECACSGEAGTRPSNLFPHNFGKTTHPNIWFDEEENIWNCFFLKKIKYIHKNVERTDQNVKLTHRFFSETQVSFKSYWKRILMSQQAWNFILVGISSL